MTALLELALALAASVLLLCLGWILVGKLLDPAGLPGVPVYLVIRGRGSGEGLEQAVNALLWHRSGTGYSCPVLLLEDDLNEEGRRAARLLSDRRPELTLCRAEELEHYFH